MLIASLFWDYKEKKAYYQRKKESKKGVYFF